MTALLMPLLLLVVGFGVDRLAHRNELLRGVHVAGVELGGLSRAAAHRKLGELAAHCRDEPLEVRIGARSFELIPQKVGYAFDVEGTLARAFTTGRQGNALRQLGWWLGRWFRPVHVAPVASLEPARLEELVAQWEAQALEGRPSNGALLVRDLEIVADYPRPGRGVLREGLAERLLEAVGSRTGKPVELPLGESAPSRPRAAVDRALRVAVALTRGPVVLSAKLPIVDEADAAAPGAGSPPRSAAKPPTTGTGGPQKRDAEPTEPFESVDVTFRREDLLAALRTRARAGSETELEPTFDVETIERILAAVRERVERPPRDARFVVDKGDRMRVISSANGVVLDGAKVTAALLEAARRTNRRGELPFEQGAAPKLTTAQAEALGITKLVGEFTTQFPCCQPRVQNIHRMASTVDGTLVLPGETLSLNTIVGPRTKAAGYVEAPAIEEGELVDAVGGGVSQFATTLFYAAFRAGYEVLERAPHSLYFQRYPIGLDATLSYPKPDLIIRNDTEAGLLVKTEHTKTSITIKLFGDTGKRKVEWKRSPPFDLVEPPTRYLPNPDRKHDTEKVKYAGQSGWSVHVSRTVTIEGAQPRVERRKVTYKPRPRELEVHPCRIPKGEEGHTGERCPEPETPEEPEPNDEPEQAPKPDKPKDATKPAPTAAPQAPKKKGGEPKGPPPKTEPTSSSAEDLIPPTLLPE